MKRVNKQYISNKVIDADAIKNESIAATIAVIKSEAQKISVDISDGEFAASLNITEAQLKMHVENDDAPSELIVILRSKYKEFLNNSTYHRVISRDSFPDPEDIENGEQD